MRIPIGRLADALKMGVSTLRDSDEPVRVAVFVDRTASPDIVAAVRDALVPQTTSALVRVAALDSTAPEVKPDTDVALVLSCGSDLLEDAVRGIVVAGAPTVVLAESSVEVPFIEHDTPMLGLIASTDRTGLLESLARWILDRTDKATAFAPTSASCAPPRPTARWPPARSPTWPPGRSSSSRAPTTRS